MSPTDEANGQSVLGLIRSIQTGSIAPQNLAADDRLRCVEHLTGEGYSSVEIAEILKVTERTIRRDRARVRSLNALERDPKLAGEMAGQLVQQAESTVSRIRQVTRQKDTPPEARIGGERACWVVINELVQRLQSLGFLPTAPMEVRGQIGHHVGQAPSCEQMNEELARLEAIAAESGDEHVLGEVAAIREALVPIAVGERIGQVRTRLLEGEPDHGT